MASNNGSIFAWNARPSKLIQSLAPDFHEVQCNIWYVEKEDEFEEEFPDENERKRLQAKEQKLCKQGLVPLDERQRKLAERDLDITKPSPGCLSKLTKAQIFAQENPDLRKLNVLFDEKSN